MTKKILLIIGILILVGIAVFVIFKEPKLENGSRVGFSLNNYFPFGGNNQTSTTSPKIEESNNQNTGFNAPVTNAPIPRLRKLSNEPVAGAVIYNVGSTSLVRFVERGTGNVYEASSDSLAIQRLTNTTIPKVIRAIWLKDASGFLAQTLSIENEIIETSFVSLKKAVGNPETLTPFATNISKLPSGIKEIVPSEDSKKIFYYTVGSGASFYIANPDGTGSNFIFSHPLSEWLLRTWQGNSVLMQTKESYNWPANFYNFNLKDGSIKNTQNPLASVRNPSSVFIDKCALPAAASGFLYCAEPVSNTGGTYPDDWYKGTAITDDKIVKIDLKNGVFYNIIRLSDESGESMDVADPSVSKNEHYMIFKNKIDDFLWMLQIETP